MRIPRNRFGSPLSQTGLILLFIVMVAAGSRLQLDKDVLIPISLQSFFLCLGFLMLRPFWRQVAVLTYLALGIAGLSVFQDGASGWDHFTGTSLGFFVGFVLSSFIPAKAADFQQATTYAVQVHGVLLLCGSVYVAAMEGSAAFGWELFQYLLPGAVVKSLLIGAVVWAGKRWLSPE